jgi:hypothetical protein
LWQIGSSRVKATLQWSRSKYSMWMTKSLHIISSYRHSRIVYWHCCTASFQHSCPTASDTSASAIAWAPLTMFVLSCGMGAKASEDCSNLALLPKPGGLSWVAIAESRWRASLTRAQAVNAGCCESSFIIGVVPSKDRRIRIDAIWQKCALACSPGEQTWSEKMRFPLSRTYLHWISSNCQGQLTEIWLQAIHALTHSSGISRAPQNFARPSSNSRTEWKRNSAEW